MNRTKLLLLFLLVGICSCNQIKEQEIILDDNIQNSEDSIAMSSFIKVEKAIKLETSPSCLIGNIRQIIKKNGLYYINSSNSPLKVFKKTKNGSKIPVTLEEDKHYVVGSFMKNRFGSCDLSIVFEHNLSKNTIEECGYCICME